MPSPTAQIRLRARQVEFAFPRQTLVVGIVNVTPDSFSDGGQFLNPAAAIAQGVALVVEGADMLDIGGESTRPGAEPVTEAEELRRVLPVIEGLANLVSVPISVDTMKPGVARAALQAGASLINDVGANRAEKSLWRVVADAGAGYVCMHMQGTPQTMQKEPRYGDVVEEVANFFRDRLSQLCDCGVPAEQIILDPGFGFGKTLEHNLKLLGGLGRFVDLGRPLMVGVSRKSFLGRLTGTEPAARLPAGLACASLAVASGVNLLRVHEVAATVQAARMAEAIQAHRNS